ncbi:hypothetical protein STEG23_001978, partial [Scotinomys teguina]
MARKAGQGEEEGESGQGSRKRRSQPAMEEVTMEWDKDFSIYPKLASNSLCGRYSLRLVAILLSQSINCCDNGHMLHYLKQKQVFE